MVRRPQAMLALLLASLCCIATVGVALAADSTTSRNNVDLFDRLSDENALDEQTLWLVDFLGGAETTEQDIEDRFSQKMIEAIPADNFLLLADNAAPFGDAHFEGVIERTDTLLEVRVGSESSEVFSLQVVVGITEQAKIDGVLVLPLETEPVYSQIQVVMIVLAAASLLIGAYRFLVIERLGLSVLFSIAASCWVAQLLTGLDTSALFALAAALPWLGLGLALAGIAEIGSPKPMMSRGRLGFTVGVAVFVLAMSAWLTQIETAELALPDNSFAVGTNPGTAGVLLDIRSVISAVLAAAYAVVVLKRYATKPSDPRAVVRLVSAVAVIASLSVVGLAELWLFAKSSASLLPPTSWLLIMVLIAAVVLVSTLLDHLRTDGLAQLVVDIGDGAPTSSIEGSLRRVLDDPELDLLVWSNDEEKFLNVEGVVQEPCVAERAITHLEVDGQLLGAVIHQRSHRPEQIRAACSAARLAIENHRLHAQVRRQLQEVRASRVRLVTAADDARRQLERDLHDGAQQSILAGLLEIQRARRSTGQPDETDAALEAAAAHLESVLVEVREIAQGLRPGALDRGLVPAIRELADRCSVAVNVTGSRERVAPHLEQAVYYVVSEALTNVSRHAEATAANVTVKVEDALVVSVADNGNGQAQPRPGGGLEGVIDRVHALDGQLTIDTTVGEGTKVVVTIPLPATNERPLTNGALLTDETIPSGDAS